MNPRSRSAKLRVAEKV
ncbi:MAG: hypothetical protein LC627_02205 [Verrucomicrobiaceae bacterium]|nr:hypothetical protein [Verrucomicrobiaceae bacterium]